MINLGYCCINTELKDNNIQVNRGMVKNTYINKGRTYAGELAFYNIIDLYSILKWNVKNNILVYRMSSSMFPWMSEYNILDLPNFGDIAFKLQEIGKYIKDNELRISFHPGHFNVLGSENVNVVYKSVIELNQHAEIMDIMGLPSDTRYPINIHLNSTKPNKIEASMRFCEKFRLLSQSCKNRLTVENDDFKNQYTPFDIYAMVYSNIGIPICFDYFHYKLNSDPIKTEFEDVSLAQPYTIVVAYIGSYLIPVGK